MPKTYYVYILTNKTNKVLYVGVTNNLEKRVFEHKNNISEKSFTATYNVHKLVSFEETSDINSALNREKQIKAGSRQKKLDLINKVNPEWKDLLAGLGY
ncbi:MAG: GIY-YIG nuclease superfamily protein [Parcubacteria group bacterium ADurb.Bin192]|nr:MAG: GIY-YIG nuclease superfamily protein [Parcubacteria group bacterium ADurb.Bin192]